MRRFKFYSSLIFVSLCLTELSSLLAADCQIRNLGFVGINRDGWLIVNGEMWNGATASFVGYAGNAALCNVNPNVGNIVSQTCQGWYSIATATMLSNKKLYVNAPECVAGNPANISVNALGLNH